LLVTADPIVTEKLWPVESRRHQQHYKMQTDASGTLSEYIIELNVFTVAVLLSHFDFQNVQMFVACCLFCL
jgi:hypothetical protein